jgi:hypothetical protein
MKLASYREARRQRWRKAHPPLASSIDDLVAEDEAASSANEVSRSELFDDLWLVWCTLWAHKVDGEIWTKYLSDWQANLREDVGQADRGEEGEERESRQDVSGSFSSKLMIYVREQLDLSVRLSGRQGFVPERAEYTPWRCREEREKGWLRGRRISVSLCFPFRLEGEGDWSRREGNELLFEGIGTKKPSLSERVRLNGRGW